MRYVSYFFVLKGYQFLNIILNLKLFINSIDDEKVGLNRMIVDSINIRKIYI